MASEIQRARVVLAVHDLERSTAYYRDVLGFSRAPIDADGWSFMSRDGVQVMLGECPGSMPATKLGDHSYVAYFDVTNIDALHGEIAGQGADICSPLAEKPWGMKEFGVRTVDGHRFMFGEEIG